jgi:hypothetical protein
MNDLLNEDDHEKIKEDKYIIEPNIYYPTQLRPLSMIQHKLTYQLSTSSNNVATITAVNPTTSTTTTTTLSQLQQTKNQKILSSSSSSPNNGDTQSNNNSNNMSSMIINEENQLKNNQKSLPEFPLSNLKALYQLKRHSKLPNFGYTWSSSTIPSFAYIPTMVPSGLPPGIHQEKYEKIQQLLHSTSTSITTHEKTNCLIYDSQRVDMKGKIFSKYIFSIFIFLPTHCLSLSTVSHCLSFSHRYHTSW